MIRRFNILTLCFCLTFSAAFGQVLRPVEWTAKLEKVNSNTFDLVFTAKIENGWYLYSQHQERNDGPLPTTFIFQKNKNYERVGEIRESSLYKINERDAIFNMVVAKYKKRATFSQRIVLKNPAKILVMIEYMSCKETACLPERYIEFEMETSEVGRVYIPSAFID